MFEMHQALASSAELCGQALLEFLSLFKPAITRLKDREPETLRGLSFLHVSCLDRSSTVAFLVAYARIWDAEALTRSVLEGTYKLLFLCVNDTDERLKRVAEYCDQLPEIERLALHHQVEASVVALGDSGTEHGKSLRALLLNSVELARLKERWPSNRRKELKTKWSFRSMAEQLAKSDLPAARRMEMMRYEYSRASGLIHMGTEGMHLQLEHAQRPRVVQRAHQVAHGLGLLSEVFNLALFRCIATYRLVGLRVEPVLAMRRKYAHLSDEASKASAEWERCSRDSSR